MLRCAYAEGRLRALIDGELAPAESKKVLAHLESCSSCRQEHARLQLVASLLHDQDLEDVPAHFTPNLELRLARYRRERAEGRLKQPGWSLPLRLPFAPRPRWSWAAGGLTTVAVTAALCAVFLSRGIGAAEIARRAELSWAQVQNYGCVFVSRGVYQGQNRVFTQKQFFRKPGEFRLDTGQDYPLTTYVSSDRVVHYLPGGHWDDCAPLVIVRPRTDARDAVPFPFGVTWQSGGNVSLDGLIRQLNQNHDAQMAGTEMVGDRECYRLQFSAPPSAGRPEDRYELWVDKESFLPRRLSWYRDPQNHIVTETQSLQVNSPVFPAGTFEFPMPAGAKVIHGDVDPHVFAMPFVPDRPDAFATEPIASSEEEIYRRGGSVPFPVLTPHYLPEGYQLIRVRRRTGHWLDAHWIRSDQEGVGHVIKLVEQEADGTPEPNSVVNLGSSREPLPAAVTEGKAPYAYVSITWVDGKTRCTLTAADLSRQEVERIARSMKEATPPPQPVPAARHARQQIEARGEPSALPTEPESANATEVRETPSETGNASPVAPSAPVSAPPMMPEMPDAEQSRPETNRSTPAANGTRFPEPAARHGVSLLP